MNIPIPSKLADVERLVVMETLRFCMGNKTRAAEMLGVSLKTIYNKVAEHKIKNTGT